jgi:hypothetical protein
MTITKRDNRWYDENYNSWLSEEAATQYSPTLTNCRECRGCSNCNDCYNCSNCSNCITCITCINCSDCSDCSNCSRCTSCNRCSNISSENDKSWFKSMYYGDEVNKEIRSELDINNRKLDLDL